MNKQASKILFSLVVSFFMLSATALTSSIAAQSNRAAPSSSLEALGALPASDGVILINVERLLQKALPRVLPPEAVAELYSMGDFLRLQVGVDPRRMNSIAIGFNAPKFITSRTLPEYYAILKGAFNTELLVKALRESNSKTLREEEYKGKRIYVFDLDAILDAPGAPVPSLFRGLSLTVFDNSTLAVGNLANVRRTIDAADGQGRINPQLVKLATLAPDALISFAALGLKAKDPGLMTTNWQTADELTRALEAIDQLSASLTMKPEGFELLLFVRTGNARQAEELKDVLLPLVRQAASMIPDERLRGVFDTLQVSTEENVLHARTEISQTLVATLIKELEPAPPPQPNAARRKRAKAKVKRQRPKNAGKLKS